MFQIPRLLRTIIEQQKDILMLSAANQATIAALAAKVASNTNVVNSGALVIQGLSANFQAALAQAKASAGTDVDLSALDTFGAQLDAADQVLANAIAANTSAATPAVPMQSVTPGTPMDAQVSAAAAVSTPASSPVPVDPTKATSVAPPATVPAAPSIPPPASVPAIATTPSSAPPALSSDAAKTGAARK